MRLAPNKFTEALARSWLDDEHALVSVSSPAATTVTVSGVSCSVVAEEKS